MTIGYTAKTLSRPLRRQGVRKGLPDPAEANGDGGHRAGRNRIPDAHQQQQHPPDEAQDQLRARRRARPSSTHPRPDREPDSDRILLPGHHRERQSSRCAPTRDGGSHHPAGRDALSARPGRTCRSRWRSGWSSGRSSAPRSRSSADCAPTRWVDATSSRIHLSAPVMAVIPKVEGWDQAEKAELVTREEPGAPASEAYRTLATNVRFFRSQQPLRVLVVTSAMPERGQERHGRQPGGRARRDRACAPSWSMPTCDVPGPRGSSASVDHAGLHEALEGTRDLVDVIQATEIENLWIVGAGSVPRDPVSLLAGPNADACSTACAAWPTSWSATPRRSCRWPTPPCWPRRATPCCSCTTRPSPTAPRWRTPCSQLRTAGGAIIGGVYNNVSAAQRNYLGYASYDEYYGQDASTTEGAQDRRPPRRVAAAGASANGNANEGQRRRGSRARVAPRRLSGMLTVPSSGTSAERRRLPRVGHPSVHQFHAQHAVRVVLRSHQVRRIEAQVPTPISRLPPVPTTNSVMPCARIEPPVDVLRSPPLVVVGVGPQDHVDARRLELGPQRHHIASRGPWAGRSSATSPPTGSWGRRSTRACTGTGRSSAWRGPSSASRTPSSLARNRCRSGSRGSSAR